MVLSERYITDRFLPDKAIDLLDEACSDVNLRSIRRSPSWRELKKERDDYRAGARMLTEDTAESQDLRAPGRAAQQAAAGWSSEIDELEAKPPRTAVTMENLARDHRALDQDPRQQDARRRNMSSCRTWRTA